MSVLCSQLVVLPPSDQRMSRDADLKQNYLGPFLTVAYISGLWSSFLIISNFQMPHIMVLNEKKKWKTCKNALLHIRYIQHNWICLPHHTESNAFFSCSLSMWFGNLQEQNKWKQKTFLVHLCYWAGLPFLFSFCFLHNTVCCGLANISANSTIAPYSTYSPLSCLLPWSYITGITSLHSTA